MEREKGPGESRGCVVVPLMVGSTANHRLDCAVTASTDSLTEGWGNRGVALSGSHGKPSRPDPKVALRLGGTHEPTDTERFNSRMGRHQQPEAAIPGHRHRVGFMHRGRLGYRCRYELNA